MIEDLLPESSRPYLRSITEAQDSHGRLAGHVVQIADIGRSTVPEGWMPWLLRDRGLQALMPYVDWPLLLEEGPTWLTIRGTAQASIDALDWIGWTVTFEHGPSGTSLYDHYQIHLDDVPWRNELERIIGIERIAKSTDSTFFRLVSGWDVRPVLGARSRFGWSLFGRHSGVDVRPDWPRLSFKVHGTMVWPASTVVVTAETMTLLTYVRRRGHVIHGRTLHPNKATRGPTFALQLSDSAALFGGAGHMIDDDIRPVAGILSGRSIHGRRQALFIAMRKVIGEKPVAGHSKFGELYRQATVRQLMMVPDPILLEGLVDAAASASTGETATELLTIARGNQLVSADDDTGTPMLAAIADLGDAPWSGLPWTDDCWGEGHPKTLASDETTETP